MNSTRATVVQIQCLQIQKKKHKKIQIQWKLFWPVYKIERGVPHSRSTSIKKKLQNCRKMRNWKSADLRCFSIDQKLSAKVHNHNFAICHFRFSSYFFLFSFAQPKQFLGSVLIIIASKTAVCVYDGDENSGVDYENTFTEFVTPRKL